MVEGLWSVRFFADEQPHGAGVVILQAGRVFGGDSSFMYRGNYQMSSDLIHLYLDIDKHYFAEGNSLDLPDSYQLELNGTPGGNTFTVEGHVVGHPERKVRVEWQKESDLL